MEEILQKLRPYDPVLIRGDHGFIVTEVIEVTFQEVGLRVKERFGCTAFRPENTFHIRNLDSVLLPPEVSKRRLVPAAYWYSSPPQYLYMGREPRYDSYHYEADDNPDIILEVYKHGKEGHESVVVDRWGDQHKTVGRLELDWTNLVKLQMSMEWAMRFGWSDQ